MIQYYVPIFAAGNMNALGGRSWKSNKNNRKRDERCISTFYLETTVNIAGEKAKNHWLLPTTSKQHEKKKLRDAVSGLSQLSLKITRLECAASFGFSVWRLRVTRADLQKSWNQLLV